MEKEDLIDWAKNLNWMDYVDDDVVYQELLKLQGRVSQLEQGIDDDTDFKVKLVAVGDGAVGKTSLLIAYAKGEFPNAYIPTVFENYAKSVDYDDKKVYLHLWDTAGQEDYDRLRPLSYPGADVVILCFSLVTRVTFEAIRNKWHPEVEHFIPECPIILVGTKVDLRDNEENDPGTNEFDPVSTEEGKKMAEEIEAAGYFELSAKTGKNLKKLFRKAIEIVLSNRKEKTGESITDDKKEDTKKESGSSGKTGEKKSKRTEKVPVEEDEDEGVVMITKTKKKKKSKNGCLLL